MKEKRIFKPPEDLSKNAYFKNMAEYEKLYKQSRENPEKFWETQAKENLERFVIGKKVLEYDFSKIGRDKNP